jgi:lysophospholipase L1-like esterase
MQYGGNVMPAVSGPKSIEWYTTSIEKDIKFLKEANPGAVMMFIGPSDMSKNIDGNIRSWPYLKEMNAALKETALKNGIAYWDMFNAMGGENSMIQWVKAYPPLASPDYIHFTHLGTETIAEMLFNSIMNDYKAFTLRQRIHYIQQDTIYKKPL